MQNSTNPDPIGLLDFISKNILEKSSDISINPVAGPHSLVLELRVNENEIGNIIGKNGRIIKAIRTLLQSISPKSLLLNDELKEFHKISLEVID